MGFRQRCEQFVSNPSYAIPAAVVLALLPLPHWIGIVLATLVLLRVGGLLSYMGYVVVLLATYASEQRYSLEGARETFLPFLSLFGPVGLMAWVLQTTRRMGLALEVGAFILAGGIGLKYLISGPTTLEALTTFFNCRRQLMGGYSEVDALAELHGIPVEQAMLLLMLVWPFLFFIFQAMLLLVARYLQAVLFYPGGFLKDFHGIRISKVSMVFFGGIFALGVFAPKGMEMLSQPSGYVIIFQLSALALGLLVIAGLGVAHWYVAFKQIGVWFLLLLYAAMVLVGPIVLPGLAVLALVDAGLDVRRRVRRV